MPFFASQHMDKTRQSAGDPKADRKLIRGICYVFTAGMLFLQANTWSKTRQSAGDPKADRKLIRGICYVFTAGMLFLQANTWPQHGPGHGGTENGPESIREIPLCFVSRNATFEPAPGPGMCQSPGEPSAERKFVSGQAATNSRMRVDPVDNSRKHSYLSDSDR